MKQVHPSGWQGIWSKPNVNGLRVTALTTLKVEVVAPIPSANVNTMVAVKPGCIRNWRRLTLNPRHKANRTIFYADEILARHRFTPWDQN